MLKSERKKTAGTGNKRIYKGKGQSIGRYARQSSTRLITELAMQASDARPPWKWVSLSSHLFSFSLKPSRSKLELTQELLKDPGGRENIVLYAKYVFLYLKRFQ